MILKVDNDLYENILEVLNKYDKTLYDKFNNIKEIEVDTLVRARKVKTERIKKAINQAIKKLLDENINPTKYQVHKKTNIAYVTLKKYYDEIIEGYNIEKK